MANVAAARAAVQASISNSGDGATADAAPPGVERQSATGTRIHRRRLIAAYAARVRAVVQASMSDYGDHDTTEAARPRAEGELLPTLVEQRSEGESSEGSGTSSSSDSASDSGEEQVQNRGNEEDEAVAVTSPIGDGGRGGEPESSNGPLVATLMDTDLLDCPICFDSLCPPVYQCVNGHIACASCCTKMRNKCANCSLPIGYNRCRAIEKVIESVRVTCRNAPRGCMETLNYNKKLAHEKICNYAPCSCPHIGCEYIGMSKSLYAHFSTIHPHSRKQFDFNSFFIILLDNNQKHVFLQERSQNVLFVLNRSIESAGSFVSVVCVAPTMEKKPYLYDIMATVGESSIKLAKTYTECMPKWIAQSPANIFLTVPRGFVGTTGQVSLALTIYGGTS